MAYLIDAWLDGGVPHLRICDAQTGAVRLDWTRDKTVNGESQDSNTDQALNPDRIAREALQRLFKELILLSCAAKLGSTHEWSSLEFGDTCLHCVACTTRR